MGNHAKDLIDYKREKRTSCSKKTGIAKKDGEGNILGPSIIDLEIDKNFLGPTNTQEKRAFKLTIINANKYADFMINAVKKCRFYV